MKPDAFGRIGGGGGLCRRAAADIDKLHGHQVAGDILGGLRKDGLAMVLQEFGARRIRAADLQQTVIKRGYVQIVKPFTSIHRIDGFHPIQNMFQNFNGILRRQQTPLFFVSLS
jgi:hypothetical protein